MSAGLEKCGLLKTEIERWLMNAVHQLHELGQSVWYDNIQRSLLEDGSLAQMISRGMIRGVTSNPSIFHNAIANSKDYDAALKPMAWAGWSATQIFTQLAIEDIQAAADLFAPLYEETQGGDGYVSLEVSPYLANDTNGTIAEAQRLWNLVNRPNLMIKIPATQEGLPAIRASIAAGINVNVTLIFSLVRYASVIDAYLSGLEDRLAAGQPVNRIASVASFFVSRVDSKVDKLLQEMIHKEEAEVENAQALYGKAAIANARLAYAIFLEKFAEPRFSALKEKGAAMQRPLWASTSTKNPAYRDVLYVEELIGANTVNTMPPQTLDAFEDHGTAQVMLGWDVRDDRQVIANLEALGISMDEVTNRLELEGVRAFADAFTALLKTIEQRRIQAQDELGPIKNILPAQIVRMDHEKTIERMFAIDAGLWTNEPAGQAIIQKRLGWLVLPQSSQHLVQQLQNLAVECRQAGYTHALLLGMGGSSLAPEVLRLIFGKGKLGGKPALDLAILDSTDPEQVQYAQNRAPFENTLFIVASKSGTTGEVSAFLDYFWARAVESLGADAGKHFIAVTDSGTRLEAIAQERGFRAVLNGDPLVGGRYSALTVFGLFPAALIGMNLDSLLDRARWMMYQCLPGVEAGRNPGLVLGTILGEAALEGRDKLTILADDELEPLGSWLEQLIAESSGKDGRGIVPVDLEPQSDAAAFGEDRLFIYFRSSGSKAEYAAQVLQAGQPVLTFDFQDHYDLGAEIYRWEIATAVACAILGVNGFDQPDVQDNKTRTLEKIKAYQKKGVLNEGKPIWEGPQGKVFGTRPAGIKDASSLKEVVDLFLRQARSGDYIAINAYLTREEKTLKKLQKLRSRILTKTRLATTLGFGPRFLHSTGQLHKGGSDRAVFLQITREPEKDLDIPSQEITFGILERAQALGDLEALLSRGRRAIRIHLTGGKLEDLI